MKKPNVARGFTLIELLIVVAIIAILAAIAVPNFLEAQVRSKVSRVAADMRTLVTGLEAYAIDHNSYPDVPRTALPPTAPIKLGLGYSRAALPLLSTPIAYVSTGLFRDPFATGNENNPVPGDPTAVVFFGYANARAVQPVPDLAAVGASTDPDDKAVFNTHRYVLQSVGPDTINYALDPATGGFATAYQFLVDPQGVVGTDFIYNPTNGTVSTGDIVRTAKLTETR